jgi:hypothetical protein
MATATKAPAKTAANPKAEVRQDDSVRIIGLMKRVEVKESENPDAKFQVTGFLTSQDKVLIGNGDKAQTIDVDLKPFDNFIASEDLARELIGYHEANRWTKIAMEGFWVIGAPVELRNGYHVCGRKALRVQSYKVLNSAPKETTK